MVGESGTGTIRVDVDAAGAGWFIDATPDADEEYQGAGTQLSAANPNGIAGTRVDLLTVVMHELGHQIGLGDQYAPGESDELMFGTIRAGERRLPGDDDAPAAGPAPVGGALALTTVSLGTVPANRTVTIVYEFDGPGRLHQPDHPDLHQRSRHRLSRDRRRPDHHRHHQQRDAWAGRRDIILQSLTLGSTIYIDANKDGNFDAGEGVSGVTLTLYADANNNGVLDGAERHHSHRHRDQRCAGRLQLRRPGAGRLCRQHRRGQLHRSGRAHRPAQHGRRHRSRRRYRQ